MVAAGIHFSPVLFLRVFRKVRFTRPKTYHTKRAISGDLRLKKRK